MLNNLPEETKQKGIIKQKPFCLWLTGLSGSGKTTLATLVKKELLNIGIPIYLLDGDKLRDGLNSDLDYSEKGRRENIRRAGEVAKLFVNSGSVVLASFISPYKKDREFVRSLFDKNLFVEVFIDCPLETCEKRDAKGLYKKARMGEIDNFTGITSPYEKPVQPELLINNSAEIKAEDNVNQIVNYLEIHNIINSKKQHL